METIILTAGMVKGTPDWQLDNQYEAETAAEWERQNAPDVEPINPLNCKNFDQINLAWAQLETMKTEFGCIETNFTNAIDAIRNTPEADKLASIFDQMSDLVLEITNIRKHLRNEAHKAWTERRFAG